ncbi:Abi family protein [Glutamicibacter sp. 2E12]|uniref:Abi family protein n=1 Tax=Glutamicibacter sp. 2E12 TaxID=3416181 RepID=UPI003CFB51DB
MSAPIKPFKSIEDQIGLLRERGMELQDDAFIRRWLESVGYYRLSGYWYTSRQVTDLAVDGKKTVPIRSDFFEPGTSFSDIAALYEFDRKLRTAIHDVVERLEVALRTAIAHELASHDPLALYERSLFRESEDNSGSLQHYGLVTQITQRINRAARGGDDHIMHNVEKYGSRLPTWVVVDVLDFSDLSKIFAALKLTHQTKIAACLGLDLTHVSLTRRERDKLKTGHPLAPWLRQLSLLRNKSAHHSRVWNCTLSPAGTGLIGKIDGLQALPTGHSERIFGCLTVLGKVLETTSPGASWVQKVRTLLIDALDSIPMVTEASLGAPSGWRTQGVWDI